METEHEEKWHSELYAAAYAGDERKAEAYTLPIVTWRNPTRLTKPESYQVATMTFALLLMVGIEPEDFERALELHYPLESHVFQHDFGEEEPEKESLRLVKFYRPEEGAIIDKKLQEQTIRLVLTTLQMFGIPVAKFMNILQLSLEEMEKEEQADGR